jgi:hydrogenase maturation protein HypF
MALEAAAVRGDCNGRRSRGAHVRRCVVTARSSQSGGTLAGDISPFVRHLVEATHAGVSAETLAAEFHWVLARELMALVAFAREPELPLALAGGTFVNQLLTDNLRAQAKSAGRALLLPRDYPPGDGGLSFGQAIAVLQESCSA